LSSGFCPRFRKTANVGLSDEKYFPFRRSSSVVRLQKNAHHPRHKVSNKVACAQFKFVRKQWKKKLKAHSILILVALLTPALSQARDARLFKVCGPFSKMKDQVGPRLLTEKAEVDTAIQRFNEINKTKRLDPSLATDIKDQGIFVCSPFVEKPLSAGDKVDELCLLYAVSGVSFMVKQVIEDRRADRDDTTRADIVSKAISEADKNCLSDESLPYRRGESLPLPE
jgi:hypothetical protein